MDAPLTGGTPSLLSPGEANDAGQLHGAGIAVDAQYVYWTNTSDGLEMGGILRVPVTGGLQVTLAAGDDPWAVAVDANFVYWANAGRFNLSNGSIMKVPIGGDGAIPLAQGQSNPHGIAIDDTNIYWTNTGTGANDGSVMKMPLGGGTPVALASQLQNPQGIVVDETSVYWTNGGTFYGGYGNNGDGQVMKLTPK